VTVALLVCGCGREPVEPAAEPVFTPLTLQDIGRGPEAFEQRLRDHNPAYRGGGQTAFEPQLGLIGQINVPTVSNLAGLKGAPFNALDLRGSSVSDITPLLGMRLTMLGLEQTRVTNLAALQGMKLEKLYLNETPVSRIWGQ
jgi:hypothetical protein